MPSISFLCLAGVVLSPSAAFPQLRARDSSSKERIIFDEDATPTGTHSLAPFNEPTQRSTLQPSLPPTDYPTDHPSHTPTSAPSDTPSAAPSQAPTEKPTAFPSSAPSDAPTEQPTSAPSDGPTVAPTGFPTVGSTNPPTRVPSGMFPTVAEPKTTGPVGFWKRLPMPSVELGPDGPSEWWTEKQAWHYLDHNILKETARQDPNFNRNAISTKSMRQWLHRLTNQQRREAIISCAVAFEQFMQAQLPDADWWLEGGSLIGAIRAPHKFVPWDSDADVTMMEESWQQVVSLLKQEEHRDPQPNAEGAPCGCLLVDTVSFGSHRFGWGGMNQIPGRVINECTGNYVDIFNMKPLNDKRQTLVLSQQQGANGVQSNIIWSWEKSVVLPPGGCVFEGYPFKCPARPWKYLDVYPYGYSAKYPDHRWNHMSRTYNNIGS